MSRERSSFKMRSQQKILKIYLNKTPVAYVKIWRVIPWFAKNVKWQFSVEIAKINGRDKKEESLNVQAANLLNSLEIFLGKNYHQSMKFWSFAPILYAQKEVKKWNWKFTSCINVKMKLKIVLNYVDSLSKHWKKDWITIRVARIQLWAVSCAPAQ